MVPPSVPHPARPRVLADPLLVILACCLGLVAFAGAVHADGWIEVHPQRPTIRPPHPHPRPVPPRLEVTQHLVDLRLDRGLASVTVDETFHNPHGRELEGTYYFPVPPGAQVEDFRAVLGGKELAGEILPAEDARRIYEELVRRVVDPAILEYYQRDLFRARVFPIPAHGDVQLSISYRHRVPSNGGLARLRYPLDTGRFAQGPYRDVRIDVEVATDGVLHSVHSPTHPLTELQRGPRSAKLRYTAKELDAEHDFLLDVIEGNGDLAGGIRAFRESDEDGWFILRLAPGRLEPKDLPPVSLVLVVDVSGSMAGDKLRQAKEALRSACARLRPVDRLQILSFSSRVTSLAEAPLLATPENLTRARDYIDALVARGGTNIDEAVSRGLAQAREEDRTSTVLVITDGAPTVGVTDAKEIVRRAGSANGGDHRIHVLGVGAQVNTLLLDALARGNRGSRTYLEGTGELEVALGALLDRVVYPAISDLALTVDGVTIDRLEPRGPWDLFHGDDLVIAGRFRGDGPANVRVEGAYGAERRAWVFPARFPRHGGEEEAAFLWAELRILRLLEDLRELAPGEGATLRQEVVDLSLRYGIVTPYTSYLIREESSGLVSSRLGRRVDLSPRLRDQLERTRVGFGRAEGEEAFDYARRAAEARQQAGDSAASAGLAAPAPDSLERDLELKKGGGKALHRVSDDDETIVDGALGRFEELPEADVSLTYLGDEYWTFLRENPGVERVLARGSSVIFRWKGQVVRVIDTGEVPPPEPPVERRYF